MYKRQDQIVLNPQTEYVRKFTEDIEKSRVIRVGTLANPAQKGGGEAVGAGDTIHDLASFIVNDSRDYIPISEDNDIIGVLDRKQALNILVGVG